MQRNKAVLRLGLAFSCALFSAFANAAPTDRKSFQTVVAKRFPGFEILRRDQFQSGWRESVRDGELGSLVVGRFNFDAYQDFAAYLVPVGTPPKGTFDGKYVECFGTAEPTTFECKAVPYPLYLPLEGNLLLVDAGPHQCLGEGDESGWVTVTSEIDSIGEYSEKGGSFTIKRRNGSSYECVDSD